MAKLSAAVLLVFGALGFASGDASDAELFAKLEMLQKNLEEFKASSETEFLTAEKNHKIEIASLEDTMHQIIERPARQLSDADAIAANAAAIASLQTASTHTWLILCGALVMFMQAGFAMVESGCCRAKNVQNILMKNLIDVCLGTLCWWAFGWSLAYGIATGENDAFANDDEHFGMGFTDVTKDGIFTPSDKMLAWFFQWAFCSAASTIVSGGIAERAAFPGYLIFTIVMTSWIYPVVVHWTWGYGWLSGGDDYQINATGFMDFAGSGIVHMCGGVAALVGAISVGPRAHRFDGGESFAPHSLPLIVLGTFILWFGWYGFNCGSTLGMSDAATGQMAAQVAMNTTLSAASCGLTVLLLRFVMFKKYDIAGMCNGILAGLVSITAPCGNVECGSAALIGFIGAFVFQGASSLLIKCKVDDPIDAFAVHGAAGAWGVLAAALFDWGKGFDHFNGWSGWSCVTKDDNCMDGAFGEAMAANLAEIFSIAAWTVLNSAAVFVPLRLIGHLRLDDEIQAKGIDETKHSPSKAYSMNDSIATEAAAAI